MRASFLDGPSLARRIPSLMRSCDKLDIAIAYVKINGLRVLFKNIENFLEKGSTLNIVFGFSSRYGITDKKSAEALLKLSRKKNVNVRKYDNPGFHPKLFIFNGENPCVLIGSSNLTGSALSTNAEANILIENVDDKLLDEVNVYFNHYFSFAPKISKKIVSSYKPRIVLRNTKKVRGITEDFLPSPLSMKEELDITKPRNLWKIAPGRDAEFWHEWFDEIDDDGEGFVAIGWDVGDLDKHDYKSLNEKVKEKSEIWNEIKEEKTNVAYVTNQLWDFHTKIKQGDIFIIYSETRILGIAEVAKNSRYQYKGNDFIQYENQMNVTYKWYEYWPRRASSRIINVLGKRGTLRKINEKWLWDEILDFIK